MGGDGHIARLRRNTQAVRIGARRPAVCMRGENKMNSYGLIFVLYEHTEEFLENLARAREFCPNMVAVDNSPEADLRLHEHMQVQGIQLHFKRTKMGLASNSNRLASV